MSRNEDLAQQIEDARDEKWVDKRSKDIARWPWQNRSTIRSLISPPSNAELYDYSALGFRVEEATAYLRELDDDKIEQLWHRLFPTLAPHLVRAWRDIGMRPYEFGYARYPFRAPRRAETMLELRSRFFLLVCDALRGLDQDAVWLAAWAPHLPGDFRDPGILGWVLGAALRGGGSEADAVREVLRASVNGEHEIGQLGRDTLVALLNSDQREDWEIVGKLLLAAQRQEGLRQSILEAIDEASPGAFRYMLGLILEHNLERFSATVRAFDVWLGMQWAGGSVKTIGKNIRRLTELLDDDDERQRTIREGEPEDVYLSLWCTALEDIDIAVLRAAPLLQDESPEKRFVALKLIEAAQLYPDSVELIGAIVVEGQEKDERIQMAAIDYLARLDYVGVSEDLFNATAKLYHAAPKRAKTLKPIVWPWAKYTHDRRKVATALRAMAVGAPNLLMPFAESLESHVCVSIVKELAGIGETWEYGRSTPRKRRQLSHEERSFILNLASSPRQDVQQVVFKAIEPLPVEEDEVEILLGLLHRSAAKLRTGAIGRLIKLPDDRLMTIIEQLLADKNAKKKAAGLELANHMLEANRSSERVTALVAQHREEMTETDLAETADRLLGAEVEVVSGDDCLGLVPPGSRSTPPRLNYVGVRLQTDAAKAFLKNLAKLFLQHAETEVEVECEGGTQRVLLGAAGWQFPEPKPDIDPMEDAKVRMPLAEIWLQWLADRPAELRDDDGLEAFRVWAWRKLDQKHISMLPAPFRKQRAWDLNHTFVRLIEWMLRLTKPQGAGKLVTQLVEDVLAPNAPKSITQPDKSERKHAYYSPASQRLDIARQFLDIYPGGMNEASQAKLAQLSMIAAEQGHGGCSYGPSVDSFVTAYAAGKLNEADFLWLLLYPRKCENHSSWQSEFSYGPISRVSTPKPPKSLEKHPKLVDAVRRMRERLVEVELTRGDRMTPASLPAVKLEYSGGAEVFFKLLTAIGRDKLVRQDQYGDPSRAYSFSRLISVTTPGEQDTAERFTELFVASGIKPARLLEAVMLSPQWVTHAEKALGMPGLEDVVWWVHAHTKQNTYWRKEYFRDMWAARISERTELEAKDLEEGAVDVAWFRRVLEAVGIDTLIELFKPAKYASCSGGHKRATLFADAMLERVTADELSKRITQKRHQDSVRALGLLPLPADVDQATAETLRRYEVFQEFKRQSRKFGSQRQASEGRAVEIAMQNLARTAGYRDPQRLQWAMETEAVADLAKGPVSITAEETSVTLSITADGDPELTIEKKGRRLKSVPAKLRKHAEISELRSRKTDLRRQRSRMRLSLEESMCRGDAFTGEELVGLLDHPMLRPMVERLVFIGEGDLIGYPDKNGKVLRNHAGKLEPIGEKDTLRIAHPVDLLHRNEWSAWQRECFAAERTQPFKQVFREVYPKTASESDKCDFTRRYAGHQVNPRQAFALLKQRQWVVAPGEGVIKTFHDEGLITELWFQESFYTPAEVEDLTLEGVAFTKRGERSKHLLLESIPDRVFSEAMRDLDLVVSVAHAGGVDPEASASTVEMRAALLRETCQLLGMKNVRVDGHHAIIDGTRASYSVHLGSATTSVVPGRMLIIVAVHSQYRGRLFLPFADDDPKTAEVLAKTLLLARDDEIKDPSILDQIRH